MTTFHFKVQTRKLEVGMKILTGQLSAMVDTTSLADNVALLVLDTYHTLTKSGKPSVRTNGISEWSILAGLIAQQKGTHLRKSYCGQKWLTN
jgi:hypothetical protein